MNTIIFSLFSSLLINPNLPLYQVQGGNMPPVITKQGLEQMAQQSAISKKADKFKSEGKWDQVEYCGRELLKMNPENGSAKYLIAQAQTNLNRPGEALATYQSIFKFTAGDNRYIRSDDLFESADYQTAFDYALLLSQQGRVEDAKAIYYHIMRRMSSSNDDEPLPITVVFDPDPVGEVWEYTAQKFEAALIVTQRIQGYVPDERYERARSLAPEWAAPVIVFKIGRRGSNAKSADVALATRLARTEAEKRYMREYKTYGNSEGRRHLPDPTLLRKQIPLLEAARKRLLDGGWKTIAQLYKPQ